jgi:hypothetical protein
VTSGRGRYVKEVSGIRYLADVRLEIRPADSLSIRLGHEWPVGIGPAEVADLERTLIAGVVEHLLERGELALWGCHIRVLSVACGEHTPLLALRIATDLAVQDMMKKADWSPEPPPRPDAA